MDHELKHSVTLSFPTVYLWASYNFGSNTAIMTSSKFNQTYFATKICCFVFEVWTGLLNIININFGVQTARTLDIYWQIAVFMAY
jgi:hypothetical protein